VASRAPTKLRALLVAMRYDFRVSLTTAILGVLAFDFFFIPPYLTFTVTDLRHTISCGKGDDDPRVGENGRIRFVGGGCTGSTVMAVGGHVTLELQSSTTEVLPGSLGVVSEDPAVIEARMNLDPEKIDLTAHAEGESRISVESEGETVDSLIFSAEPATMVKHTSVTRAFEGGAVDLRVTDVFGSCGEEYPLIGEGFLGWRVEPAAAGDFVIDFGGTASFLVGGSGKVTLVASVAILQLEQAFELEIAD
jgi:uncharacterized protein DUF4118